MASLEKIDAAIATLAAGDIKRLRARGAEIQDKIARHARDQLYQLRAEFPVLAEVQIVEALVERCLIANAVASAIARDARFDGNCKAAADPMERITTDAIATIDLGITDLVRPLS